LQPEPRQWIEKPSEGSRSVSIISALRARGASESDEPAAACWVCSGGNGPMCAWCSRRVRDTATREGVAPAGDERPRRSR